MSASTITGMSSTNVISQHASILTLPEEVLVLFIGLGTPSEIRRWREVSRIFRKFIDESHLLQYLLQLGQLGYIEPVKPRRDLTYSDKIDLLRKHQSRLANLTESDYTKITFRGNNGHLMNCKFSRGVFAHLNPVGESNDPMITVYEIPSYNRALEECSIWSLTNLGVLVEEFGMSISLDLLVLFEIDATLPLDDGTSQDTGPMINIHLRSLRSGSTHHAAAVPVLTYPTASRSRMDFDICFRIVGDHLMVLFNTPPGPVGSRSDLIVWNWTSGKQIARTSAKGDSFAFVSPNIFVIPHSRTSRTPKLDVLGQLDIFTFNPQIQDQNLNVIHHIATFQFPDLTMSALVSFVSVDNSASPSAHSRTVPQSRIPEKLYDVSPGDEILCVTFSVILNDTDYIEAPPALGVLLIHHSVVLNLLSLCPAQSGNSKPHIIPWPQWGHSTVWAHASYHEISNFHFSSSGHLASFINGRHVTIYDVRPRYLRQDDQAEGQVVEEPVEHEQRLLVKELERMFLSGTGRARMPKVVATFRTPGEFEDPIIVMDDEHVILVDEAFGGSFGNCMYVYAF